MARTATAAQIRALEAPHRSVHLRVRVANATGTLVDLTALQGRDWVVSADWGGEIDSPVGDARVTISRSHHLLSLARDVETSRLNLNASGVFAPALDVGRRIVIDVAVLPQGVVPTSGQWVEVFDGRIDAVDWGNAEIEVTARDRGGDLMDQWIEAERPQLPGPTALADLMQATINEWASAPPTLYVPTDPGWMLGGYQPDPQPLLDHLTELAAQIGWVVRYRWDNGTSAWRLTLLDPDRAKTVPDHVLSPDGSTGQTYQRIERCGVELASIRNVVSIVYTDVTVSEADPDDRRREVVRSDSTSIARYGRRWMQVAEASSSRIDTEAEAERMADAILSDLSEPRADLTVTLPLDWRIDLCDLVRLEPNGVLFTEARQVGVVSVRHRLANGAGATEIQVRGTPAGYHRRWADDYIARAGSGLTSALEGPDAPVPVAVPIAGGLEVAVPWVSETELVEVHTGPASGFTPSSTTLRSRSRSRLVTVSSPPGEFVGLRVASIDRHGNRSSFSDLVAVAAARPGPHLLSPVTARPRIADSGFGSLTRGPDYPPDGWHMRVGGWGTEVDRVSDGTSILGDHALLMDGASEIVSDWFPVQPLEPYRFAVTWRANGNDPGQALTVNVEWYSDQSTLHDADEIIGTEAAAINTWQTDTARRTAPSAARWARLALTGSTGVLIRIGAVEWEQIPHSFSAYLTGDQRLTAGVRAQILIATEVYDLGAIYDTATRRLVVRVGGIYALSAGALVDGATSYARIALYRYGSIWREASGAPSGEDGIATTISVVSEQLDAGDTVDVRVIADGSPEVIGGEAATWFSGRRVS